MSLGAIGFPYSKLGPSCWRAFYLIGAGSHPEGLGVTAGAPDLLLPWHQPLMLGGSLSTDDAVALAVVVQKLPLDVARPGLS
jgi:hypothetical protein